MGRSWTYYSLVSILSLSLFACTDATDDYFRRLSDLDSGLTELQKKELGLGALPEGDPLDVPPSSGEEIGDSGDPEDLPPIDEVSDMPGDPDDHDNDDYVSLCKDPYPGEVFDEDGFKIYRDGDPIGNNHLPQQDILSQETVVCHKTAGRGNPPYSIVIYYVDLVHHLRAGDTLGACRCKKHPIRMDSDHDGKECSKPGHKHRRHPEDLEAD